MPYVKRTGMRKRAYTRRTNRKTYAKKGLTKVEKTQVKSIAKRAVNVMVESKYFNVNTITNQAPNPIWQFGGVNSEIGCWGFTTGVRRNADSGSTYKLGVDPTNGSQTSMTTLSMNTVFRSNNSVVSRQQYSLEGLTCRPAYNEVQWLLERPQSNTISDATKAVPYQIRMIRLKPRVIKASYQVILPSNDCFLNSLNESFGPSSLSTQGAPSMIRQDFFLAKVNSRKYNVVEDTRFTMLPSSIQGSGDGDTPLVLAPNNSGYKIIKTRHNMGKEFHYNNPDAGTGSGGLQEPSAGFEPEFILFFVAAVGGVPAGTLTDNIQLSARPVSTFKDA